MAYFLRSLAYVAISAVSMASCEVAPCMGVDYREAKQQMAACLESSITQHPVNQYGVNCTAIANHVDGDTSLETCMERAWEEEGCPSDCSLGIVGDEGSTQATAWSATCEATPAIAEIRCEVGGSVLSPVFLRVPSLPGFQDLPF